MSRRDMFRLAGALGVVGTAGVAAGFRFASDSSVVGAQLTSEARLPEPFTVPFVVPPVLAPESRDATTDYYRVTQRVAAASILPGYATPIWGYNGVFPGPTIVSARGRRTVVTHRNKLPVPTVVHLHGGHVPHDADGYPTDLLLPVGSDGMTHTMAMHDDPLSQNMIGERDYAYPMNQPAATLWYHDHRMDFTGAAVWQGLAGLHLVVDEDENRLRLPAGDRDLPVMITDRAFRADGSLRYPAVDRSMMEKPGVTGKYVQGVLGDVILVNGVPWPVHRVGTARYRLRLVNASNARVYRLRFDSPGGRANEFVQIGSDGGLLERAQRLSTLDIAPGERFDVIVDFTGCAIGDQITLHNDLGSGNTTQIMRFVIAARVEDISPIPDALVPIERLNPAEAVHTRQFDFRRGEVGGMTGWRINGHPYSPGDSIADPRLGDLEIWRFTTDLNHPIHLHLNHFQVLSRNNKPPHPTDAGWKDTLNLTATEVAEVAISFTDHPGRYVLHCHNLEHEDMAMMATFTTH
ncbi:multicopper oxidase domain-containing protein [Nocardia sp. SYP-A9097]|uniref:multicopper oxidase family protein n=1 Tax=Nocardia sp. SYP-A9097 TaxID=2663237 RepID=UPI00129A4406|nr:multicopper oxidase domain-containing protein [Nocardia sp. SYP-A9097]MRH86055.1 multicopper oxidase domain-containing protein [Nocardia sp. SYP-A9097]